MTGLKEQALRELGDQGADTLNRYFAQINYTVYWCIRMLRRSEGLEVVIPEGGEDLVLLRRGVHELHQVKTRNESQGPWKITEVLPILCQQYHRRKYFLPHCHFHFVTDQIADNKTQKPGSLYRLKHLLEIKHTEQVYRVEEQLEFEQFEHTLGQLIQETMKNKHAEDIDRDTAVSLLHNTWIETECPLVRTPDIIAELEAALDEVHPGLPSYTILQLRDMHERLIILIVRKIIETISRIERHIYYTDVLNCRSSSANASEKDLPDLSQVPGKTNLDKKARLGGFNIMEISRFHRHKVLAENLTRRCLSLGIEENLERLVAALLEYQGECWDRVCRLNGTYQDPGPQILRMLKQELPALIAPYRPLVPDIDEMLSMGLLWRETDKCYAWWSELKSSA